MTNMEERKKKVKAKARITTTIVALIMFVMLLVSLGIPTSILEIVIESITYFLMGLLMYGCYRLMFFVFDDEDERKESKKFAESVLSSKVQTEVLPIKNNSEDEKFIFGLTNIAKFYAIINEKDKIQISVKFDNENELRKQKTISKEFFQKDYKLPDDTKVRK